MDCIHVALRQMKPRNHDDLLAYPNILGGAGELLEYLQNRVRRAFKTLPWRFLQPFQ